MTLTIYSKSGLTHQAQFKVRRADLSLLPVHFGLGRDVYTVYIYGTLLISIRFYFDEIWVGCFHGGDVFCLEQTVSVVRTSDYYKIAL